MPRKSRDTDLSTPTARRRLKPKPNRAPYYRSVAQGQFLGYRKTKTGPGTWTTRLYLGTGRYEEAPLGTADDEAPADGSKILDYSQAIHAALAFQAGNSEPPPEPAAAYTVDQAMLSYLEWYKAHRKPAGYRAARVVVSGTILPAWGGKPVEELTTASVRKWHQDLASSPARFRPGRAVQKTREVDPADIDALRKRKATANRILTVFKAALNLAVGDERVPPELAPRWSFAALQK